MKDRSRPANQPCRIYLVRHGKTALNVDHRFRGLIDIPLSHAGQAEAREAADNLIGSGITTVYTSPLYRARQVAEAIASVNGLDDVRDHDGLLILDYGRWTGLTREESAFHDPEAFHLYVHDPESCICPKGEGVRDAGDRIVDALLAIGRDHPGEAVAAVSHGIMLRLAVLRVAGPSDDDWQFALPTGSAVVFEVEGDEIRLVSDLDRSHRKDEPTVAEAETATTG